MPSTHRLTRPGCRIRSLGMKRSGSGPRYGAGRIVRPNGLRAAPSTADRVQPDLSAWRTG